MLLRRYRVVDADNKGIDKLAIQVDSVGDYYAEATVPVDVTGTPLGTAGNPLVTTGAGVGGGAAATATAAPPTYVEGASVPLSVDLNGTLRTTAGAGGGGGATTIADGADVAQGATTDLAYTTGSGTVVGLLKGIFGKVAGTLAVSVQNATLAVTQSGTWSQDVTDRAARLLGHTTVDNFPATQPVSGTVTATGPLTDTQLRATAVPVSGTFFQATQPVSGTVTSNQGTPNTAANGWPAKITDGTNTAAVLSAAPVSDTGQSALAVRVVSQLGAGAGGGGGGAVTIADGADVAQGTTTDLAWTTGAGTVIALLKAAVNAIKATLTADVTDRAARLLGHVTVDNAGLAVTGTFWQATQPVSGTVAISNAVALDTTVGTTNTELGGLTETAPATDTASSGLNGRLQRVAQRLTSLIAQLPASLGQKTMANSMAVVVASDQSVIPSNISQLAGVAPSRTGIMPVFLNIGASTTGNPQEIGWSTGQSTLPVSLPAIANTLASTAPAAAMQGLVVALSPNVAAAGNVRNVKDSNRTSVVLNASSIASVTTEALVTIQKNVGGTVTTGVTEYVVTAGKTLRVQVLRRGCRFTTMSTTVTFANTTIKLRQSATTLATSSALVSADNLSAASNFPTPDTNSEIPDGLEFPGGTHIGFSHVGSAATLSQDVTLIGYEY